MKNRLCHSVWHQTHQHPWTAKMWLRRIRQEHRLYLCMLMLISEMNIKTDWQLVTPRGGELGICQCMTMTIISPSLSLSPSSLCSSLPVCLPVSDLVSYLCPGSFSSWFIASICLRWFPCGAMKRDREEGKKKKNSLNKGSSAVNYQPRPQPSSDADKIQMARKAHR